MQQALSWDSLFADFTCQLGCMSFAHWLASLLLGAQHVLSTSELLALTRIIACPKASVHAGAIGLKHADVGNPIQAIGHAGKQRSWCVFVQLPVAYVCTAWVSLALLVAQTVLAAT